MEHLLRTSTNILTTRPFSSEITWFSAKNFFLRLWIGKSWLIHTQSSLFFSFAFLKTVSNGNWKVHLQNHLSLFISNIMCPCKSSYTKIAETHFLSFFLKLPVFMFSIAVRVPYVILLENLKKNTKTQRQTQKPKNPKAPKPIFFCNSDQWYSTGKSLI